MPCTLRAMATKTPSPHIAALFFDLHSGDAGTQAAPAVPARMKVLPDGRFNARDGRPGNMEGVTTDTWHLDAALGAALVRLHATLGLDMVIDYEHQTLRAADNGQPAPAAGWITALDYVAGDGLYATVSWTDEAQAALLSKKYRYLSPVFAFDPDTGDVLELLHVALTNNPALTQLPALAALSARSVTQPKKDNFMDKTQVLAALSLPADTSDTTALAALSALPVTLAQKEQEIAALKANQFDPAKHIPLDEHKKVSEQLAALSAKQEAAAHSQLMTAALSSGTILPPNEAYWRKQPLAALQEYLKDAKPLVAALSGTQTGGVAPAAATATAALTAEEQYTVAALGLDAAAFAKAKA